MAAVKLSLATLGELNNGIAAAVVDNALNVAVRDTEDRGLEDDKERKVVITVVLKKLGEENMSVDVNAKCVVPEYATGSTIGRVRHDGPTPSIEFQAECADRPDQQTIPYEKE